MSLLTSSTVLDKSFAPQSRQISYMNRDFDSLKQSLINFSKQYYSKTYQDFNPSSPGMMFIEQASYVGDVISFYNDYLFKESLFSYSNERKNVIQLSKYLGYTTKPSRPSIVTLTVQQLVPSVMNSDGTYSPNLRYAFKISSGMICSSQTGTSFITTTDVDFSTNTIYSPRVDSVFSYTTNNIPDFFLLQKTVEAFSGEQKTTTVDVGQTPNLNVSLQENNVISVKSVTDDDNNKWYEVDYLAQDLVLLPVENNDINFNQNYYNFSDVVPNIIRFLRTDRKFLIQVDENNITSLQFGPSVDNVEEQILIPSSDIIGPGFSNLQKYNLSLNPTFYSTSPSYGTSPSNTKLTVNYIVGGGLESNVPVNSINIISSIRFDESTTYLSSEESLVSTLRNTVRVNNNTPAAGGAGQESVEEIKMNALALFSAQNRVVTTTDYVTSLYNMPKEYGRVAKAYASSELNSNYGSQKTINGLLDANGNVIVDESNASYRRVNFDSVNPFGINLYILSYNSNKKLIKTNDALINNIKNYMYKYRIASDRINIIDGYIVNIGIDFSIIVYKNYNKREVLLNCVAAVQNFFNIDNWQFMQSINISQLHLEIANVEGVQSVADLSIRNIVSADGSGSDYSLCEYDIKSATKNNIVYPPMDVSIFEVKYPDTDIRGKCV